MYQQSAVNRQWPIANEGAHGLWLMAYGSWLMAHGLWLVAYGSWLLTN